MQTRIAKMGAAIAAVALALMVARIEAFAAKGSIATGGDTGVPTCTPQNGGIAKVRIPMGNCG
jgi:hypothetical protein